MKKISVSLLILSVVLLFGYCSPDPELDEAKLKRGFTLLENTCFSCHDPGAESEDRVAPPMFAVKNHYLEKGISEEEFISLVVSFVKEPKKEASRMPGALRKFGLMPKLGLADEQVGDLAYYIYHSELETPGWYEQHYKQERERYFQEPTDANRNILAVGKQHALSTKAVLGKNLLGALQKSGSSEALVFCNERAVHLTDSMQDELGIKIKRVSDKNRNPDNEANLEEREYIIRAKHALASDGDVKPKLRETISSYVGYYPIITNDMCLQCHGQEKDIDPETLAKIKELYPEDKAIGYGANELRGIWVVEMKKE